MGEPPAGLAKIGLYLLCTYLFLAFGRIPELFTLKTGLVVPIMPVVMMFAVMISFLTGGVLSFLSARVVLMVAAYYGWTVLCIPFSIWKGGSVPFVLYELKMAVIFIVILSLIRNTQQIRTAMLALAFSMIVLTLISGSVDTGDRERLSFEGGSLANPNELANHLLIGLPLSWVIGIGRPRFSLQNILRFIVLMIAMVMLVKTGSRGGVVIAATLVLILFFTSSIGNKLKLVLAGAAMALTAISFAPHAVMERYRTLFSDDVRYSEAVESKASRTELLKASIRITLHHPIFGVGPANFVVAYNEVRHREGLFGYHWEATHNAYTQVSSEKGIPGLLLYAGAFFLAMKRLLALRSAAGRLPQLSTLHEITSMLLLSMLAYAVSGFFTSNAHQFYFPLLVGLAVVVEHYGRQDLRAATAPRSVVAVAAAPAAACALPREAAPRRTALQRFRPRA